jgi:hypothetical protein
MVKRSEIDWKAKYESMVNDRDMLSECMNAIHEQARNANRAVDVLLDEIPNKYIRRLLAELSELRQEKKK